MNEHHLCTDLHPRANRNHQKICQTYLQRHQREGAHWVGFLQSQISMYRGSTTFAQPDCKVCFGCITNRDASIKKVILKRVVEKMQEKPLVGIILAFCSAMLVVNSISRLSLHPTKLRAHATVANNQKHIRNLESTKGQSDSSTDYSGLSRGAENYYHPQLMRVPVSAPILAQDPIGQWGDVMQRFTRELSTDTMEIANLDNEVMVQKADIQDCLEKF